MKSRRLPRKRTVLRIVLIVLIALILLFGVIPLAIVTVYMRKNFTRYEYADDRLTCDYRYSHYQAEYPRQDISFKSGKNTLRGHIYGASNTKGLIVFAHGIGTGHESYIEILLSLVDRGWVVLAYDATGSCESDGDSTVGLVQSALDLDSALTFAESDPRLKDLPMFVMGHSWGGYASAAVLNFDHDVRGCVTMSGYDSPIREISETGAKLLGGRYKIIDFYITVYSRMKFGKNYDLKAVDGINKADIPVLVVHGSNDRTVRYDGAAIINQKKKIKNKKVKYKVMKERGRRGHNTYLFSKKAIKYINKELNPAYEALWDEYYGTIPEDALVKFFASADADLVNEINLELVGDIDEFFNKQLTD